MPEVAAQRKEFVGLLAIALAATNVVTELLGTFLPRLGKRWEGLGTSFSWFVFDWGFVLMLVALMFAVIAVGRGGHERRLGFLALLLIGASIVGFIIP